jgi:hypothetical protein
MVLKIVHVRKPPDYLTAPQYQIEAFPSDASASGKRGFGGPCLAADQRVVRPVGPTETGVRFGTGTRHWCCPCLSSERKRLRRKSTSHQTEYPTITEIIATGPSAIDTRTILYLSSK